MPTIAQVANAAIPAGVDLTTWLNSRNGLNSATSTINTGATQAGQQIDAATATALQAQKDAAAKQQGLYDTTVTNNQPYQDQGKLSLAQLQKLGTNTFDPSSVATDPGYQFGMNEGIKGGQRAAAASGTAGNGGQVRAQTRYALDYATTKYNDAFQRFLQSQQSGLSIAQAGINAGQHSNDEVQAAGTTLGNQDQTNATTQGTFGVNAAEDKASLTLAQAELAARNQSAQSANTNNALSAIPGIAQKTIGLLTKGSPSASPQPGDPNFVGPTQPGPQPGDPNFVGPIDSSAAASDIPLDSSAVNSFGNLPGSIGESAALGAPAIGGAVGGAATIGSLSSVASGAVPALPAGAAAGEASASAALAGLPGVDPAAATIGTGEVSSSALSAIHSLLWNPYTAAIGAAIGTALIWKASQTHPVASEFVSKFQDPFVNAKGTGQLNKVVDEFDKAYASGQMTKGQAMAAYQQTANLIQSFMNDGAKFAQKGDKESSVWNQSLRTMAEDFGGTVDPKGHNNQPNWSKILGKMQQEINALPETAAA